MTTKSTCVLGTAAFFACIFCSNALADDLKLHSVDSNPVGIGDAVSLQIDGIGASLNARSHNLSDFIFYFDRYPVATGADAALSDTAHDKIGFRLTRNNDNKAAWTAILGSPLALSKDVAVGVGFVGASSPLPTTTGREVKTTLIVIRPFGLLLGAIFIAVFLLLVVWVGKSSDLLRGNSPENFGGATGLNGSILRRPYSLAQSQMAWWFALVLGAYVFLFLITGDVNTLTAQSLILMGIGTGTALGATMIENNKTDPVLTRFNDVLAKIAAAPANDPTLPTLKSERDNLAMSLASQNYLGDVLSDANGVGLHRFQLLGWTVVIGLIFIAEVYQNLTLPTFDTTVLALIGISSGTYLGFKVPE